MAGVWPDKRPVRFSIWEQRYFYSGLRLRVHFWQRLPTQHGADESVSVDLLIMNPDTKNAVDEVSCRVSRF